MCWNIFNKYPKFDDNNVTKQEKYVNDRIANMQKDGRWNKIKQDKVSIKQIKGRLRMNFHNHNHRPGYTRNKNVY